MGGRCVRVAWVLMALGSAGCGDREPASRPVEAPPPAAASGSVNPDPGITTYACADGQAITAGYPDRETAVVTYKGHAYTLKLVRSASGARYTGYGLQWWTKGDSAAIAALKPGEDIASAPGLDCSAQREPSAPTTRTSF